MTTEFKAAMGYALRTLSRSRQTRFQLEQKLKKREYEQEIIIKVLNSCEEKRYLNDSEYARLWVEDRIRFKPMGRWRLKRELFQRGIEENIIEEVLENLLSEEVEIELLERLFKEKWTRTKSYRENPRRLIGFLERRGFSKTQIFKVAESLEVDFWE